MSARTTHRKIDAPLLAACAEFQRLEAAFRATGGGGHDMVSPPGYLDAIQAIADMPARTAEGVRAKAEAILAFRAGRDCEADEADPGPHKAMEWSLFLDAAGRAAEAADTQLLRHVAELEAIHERSVGAETQGDDDALAALLAEYWAVADKIEAMPARTPIGIEAKARVLRSVIAMVGQDDGRLAQHTNGLLRDIIGEARA